MTKKLQQLFNLSDESENIIESKNTEQITSIVSVETLNTIEKVEQALPQIKGLENSDKEMDELADEARKAFDNLMDLGMQVEPRFSAEIFNSASSMLGHAITAKTAKINKKLKSIELQLKTLALKQKIPENSNKDNSISGQVMDRNEILKAFFEQNRLTKN